MSCFFTWCPDFWTSKPLIYTEFSSKCLYLHIERLRLSGRETFFKSNSFDDVFNFLTKNWPSKFSGLVSELQLKKILQSASNLSNLLDFDHIIIDKYPFDLLLLTNTLYPKTNRTLLIKYDSNY